MIKKMTMMAFMFFGVFTSISQAQESFNAAGGDGTGSGGSISYSIGQVFYSCNIEAGITENQGVQQFNELLDYIEENLPSVNTELIAYPNPATDLVNLKIENYDPDSLSYALFDMQGRLLVTNQISQSETQIQLNNLPRAVYLLNVFNNKKSLKTFKIIKKD